MKDSLHIQALRVATHIGVHAWEQRILQTLLIDVSIPSDFSTCRDQLTNTIDYDALCQTITTFVASHAFALIETVAEQVAALIQTTHNVSALTICVSKPHAVANAGLVRVMIQRP